MSSSLSLTEEIIILVLSSILVCCIWYRLITKMGFKGNDRWLYTISILIPISTLITIIYLLFWPWPVQKENEKLKEYIKKLESRTPLSPKSDVDIELDRLRGEMGMNQMKGKRKPK